MSEAEVWEAYAQDGDVNKVVVHYYSLLVSYASEYFCQNNFKLRQDLTIEDFINDGYFGLVDAIKKYNSKLGSFSTFCRFRVFGEIIDGLRRRDWAPQSVSRKSQRRVLMLTMTDRNYYNERHNEQKLAYEDPENEDYFWTHMCQGLSKSDRLLIIMYYRLDKPMSEVGKHLGVSESAISLRHRDLLGKLITRKHLLQS